MMRRLSRIGLGIVAIGAVSVVLLGLYGAWRLSQGPVLARRSQTLSGGEARARWVFPTGWCSPTWWLTWGGTERPLDLVISDAELRGEDERVVARISEISIGLSLPALLHGALVLENDQADRRWSNGGPEKGRHVEHRPGPGKAASLSRCSSPATPVAPGRPFWTGSTALRSTAPRSRSRTGCSVLRMSPERVSIDLERMEKAVVAVFDIDSWSGVRTALFGRHGGISAGRPHDPCRARLPRPRPEPPRRNSGRMVPRFARCGRHRGSAARPPGGVFRFRRQAPGRALHRQRRGGIGCASRRLAATATTSGRWCSPAATAARTGRSRSDRLDVDLGAPRLSLTGKLTGIDGTPRFHARATLDGMTMSALGRYWPRGIAKGARRWLLANLNRGGRPGMSMPTSLPPSPDSGGQDRARQGDARSRAGDRALLQAAPADHPRQRDGHH